jgi:hypothetical protein
MLGTHDMDALEIAGQLSAIATFIIAGGGYIYYRWDFYSKRTKLETYLKNARAKASDDRRGKQGQHSYFHLMKEVGLTETEILQASFKSKHIKRSSIVDEQTNRAVGLLFGYRE